MIYNVFYKDENLVLYKWNMYCFVIVEYLALYTVRKIGENMVIWG